MQTQIRRKWTAEDRANHCRQIGTLGGQETVRRYGIQYMRELARAGFATTCARYYEGNRAHTRAALIQRRRHFRTLA
jgi:hypothetical protein